MSMTEKTDDQFDALDQEQLTEQMRAERLKETRATKREFWIGQMLVIMSTILGVYLAAYEGFRVAVDFEMVTSDIDGYYLRRSLRDELRDNVKVVKNYAHHAQTRKGRHIGRVPSLSFVVWEHMRYNMEMTEIPPDVLRAMRFYYTEVEKSLDDARNKRPVAPISDALLEESELIELETLPHMECDLLDARFSIYDRVDIDLEPKADMQVDRQKLEKDCQQFLN